MSFFKEEGKRFSPSPRAFAILSSHGAAVAGLPGGGVHPLQCSGREGVQSGCIRGSRFPGSQLSSETPGREPVRWRVGVREGRIRRHRLEGPRGFGEWSPRRLAVRKGGGGTVAEVPAGSRRDFPPVPLWYWGRQGIASRASKVPREWRTERRWKGSQKPELHP